LDRRKDLSRPWSVSFHVAHLRRCAIEVTLRPPDGAGPTVLAVSGEVDVHTGPALRDRIADALDSGRPRLVVDLSGVDFLDSTGLGVLVAGLNRSQELGGTLSLVCPRPRILTVLRITGLDELFVIHPTVEDALAGPPAV
jgi:anti-sigma B factor antagonist